MTEQKKYEATDNDIPDFFTPNATGAQSGAEDSSGAARVVDSLQRSRVAVQLHYPTQKETRTAEQRFRRSVKDEANAAKREQGRKQYVKRPKRGQMYQWLIALEPMAHVLNPRESDFVTQQLWKFRKYGIDRLKWVTQGQYDFAQDIAATNLSLPGVNRARRERTAKGSPQNGIRGC